MNKKLTNFLLIIGLSVIVVFMLSLLDVIGASMWKTVCDGIDWCEFYDKGFTHYMSLFWIFAYTIIAVIGIVYYILRRDISESLAVLLTPILLIKFGLEDIFYYIIRGLPLLTDRMEWLFVNTNPAKWVSLLMGLDTVTGVSLIITFLIGLVIIFFVVYTLYKIEV